MPELVHRSPLGLTYDEEDVLRDLLGHAPDDDGAVLQPYLNALHTLRIKVSLHYSAARGVDTEKALDATERIADLARDSGLDVRLYFDFDAMSYDLRVGDRTWRWETLYTLLPRVAIELGLVPETAHA